MNLKKLPNCVDDLKRDLVLQNEMVSLVPFCKLLSWQKEDTPLYGKTENNSFLVEYVLQISVRIIYLKIY